ncbi:NrtR DNA-binding winged helix domain-containing protein [Spirosoma validum]|uniref:NUDIX domain-containing protein n=1 Tax=Spirosoma validum TaxID=2771355 RepID=A0A927BA06_9BACT|nr:NUDIX domain-containing protein [Spirosoma validum]MBD2757857.1 NUDIX domain-containing protein [Spirosoma validum]
MHPPSEQDYVQQLSIDCVIFGYKDRQLNVLVPKLYFQGDFWALPSGFVYQDEDIDEAARRILQDRTGIKDVYLEQFQVMGKAGRNSRAFLDRLIELNPELVARNPENLREEPTIRREYDWFIRRFISIGYYALVDLTKVIPQKTDLDQSIEWYAVKHLPQMIMDHNEIVEKALETLRLTLDQKLNAFNLLPETFTMKDVQELYETIFDKPFARNNFQKKILSMNALERLEKIYTGAANKAPYLYRFQK